MSTVILTGNAHLITPNSPRNSNHEILRYKDKRHLYNPERILQKIWRPLEGVSLFTSLSARYDLIHSFNAIPYTNEPWIVTFESELPRTIGFYGDMLGSIIKNRLLLDNCRQVIAMSNFAKQRFIKINEGWTSIQTIIDKLQVIHPSFPVRTSTPKKYLKGETLEIIFIGNDFARKGGIVALRVAEKAKKMKLPLKVNLISGMNYGPSVYTDCVDTSRYARDLTLINLDNVALYKKIPNEQVFNLLAKSHLQVMCTLDDTYGFSILEGFSVATPAIATNVCALPEFVNSHNGLVIDLELDESKKWINLADRKAGNYWSIIDHTYDSLVDQVLEFIIKILDDPESYEQLSIGAIAQANIHDTKRANNTFDNLYAEIIQGN
jgi:glycosyltransferase involved in cell wall biosynthesis